jgi:hypothetical protein
MAEIFNRSDNELRQPLGSWSGAHRRRLDMEEKRLARDLDADNPNIPGGDDYEYDEAHDVPAGPLGKTPTPHRVSPPQVNLGQGGDYGYDEAHDFGAS